MHFPVTMNDLAPALAGGLWGGWLYSRQDHTHRQQGHLAPGVGSWATMQYERLQRGKLGAIVAIATSSLCLFILDKFSQRNRYSFLNKPARLLTWVMFFLYAQPTDEPRYKAFFHLLRVSFKIYTTLVPIQKYQTLVNEKTELEKRLFPNQGDALNASKQSQNQALPFWIGCFWGMILHSQQDKSPTIPFPARPATEAWIDEQKNKVLNGSLGMIGTMALSGLLLLDLDDMCQSYFSQNAHFRAIQTSIRSF